MIRLANATNLGPRSPPQRLLVAVKLDTSSSSPSGTSHRSDWALGNLRNGNDRSNRKRSISDSADPTHSQRPALASTSDLDPPMLLSDLKSLQLLFDSNKRAGVSETALRFWRQWHNFLMRPKGKAIKPDMLHKVSHAFLFLCYRRLPELFGDIEAQQSSGIQFEGRTIKSLGFVSLKGQHWCILHWVLQDPKLSRNDLIILVKAACRKIAFSSALESQSSRVTTILELAKSIGLKIDHDADFAGHAGSVVEHIARTFFKMGCIDPVVPFILDILNKHPASAKSFSPTFLHQVMNTCASHQHLQQAHQLIAAIPPSLQTLDHFKACLTVWDRRTPRPLIRAACLLWASLLSHPHLEPDLAAYNLYLALRSRLGHIKDVWNIIKRMTRTGPLPDQRTYDILLHLLGQRQGIESSWNMLQHLSPQNYIPTSRTTNILLCSKAHRTHSIQKSIEPANSTLTNEMEFLAMMERVKAANFGCDEVTRNIVVRKFLARSHSHSSQQIWALKKLVLPPNSNLVSNGKYITRSEFRRMRKPLYSMLCSAFIHAGKMSDAAQLKKEWMRESQLARKEPNANIQKLK
ncbi:hypothetical protein CROQUDRAFT_341515 [Cronartium quercuum f. sp. fusiforme G11]|uniref:Pentatricopeptide repeat-containing protein n=1 Tax=Cronartium quercuum f. sp. fusiforme G11 TaxID=708437 RepID=A0A9P6TEE6_9BASI|nr:hypothetical protein CROQUDRAFT_341515 [Cronartium quercuum f. sp. fusiforme G11]